ncbi:MAG: helix-turn-helix transcriptional regulator [Phycisphaerae bacterium]|nr:helix-turn-helix transcriptional regulator [Phycisphaerae bacterium]
MARSSTSLRGNKAGRFSSAKAIDLSVNATWHCVRSPFRLRLLETIRGSGGCTVLEIARALEVSPPSLYYHIGLLLKAGLIGQLTPKPATGRAGRLGPVAAIFFANVDAIKFAPPKSVRDRQRMAKLVAGLITEHAADLAMAAKIDLPAIGNGWESLEAHEVKAIRKAFATVDEVLSKARARREKAHGKAVLATHHVSFSVAATAPATLPAPKLG